MTKFDFQLYVSNNIRFARKRMGLNQSQMADKLGVSVKQVSTWENGKSMPSVDHLLDLCDLFQVPPFAFYMKNMKKEFFDE